MIGASAKASFLKPVGSLAVKFMVPGLSPSRCSDSLMCQPASLIKLAVSSP